MNLRRNGGETLQNTRNSSDWPHAVLYLARFILFGIVMAVKLLRTVCRIPVAGIFSPMETSFCQSRCLVPPEANHLFLFFLFLSAFYCQSCLLCFFLSLLLPSSPVCVRTPTRFTQPANSPHGIVLLHPVLAGSETVAALYTPVYIDFSPSLNPTAPSSL